MDREGINRISNIYFAEMPRFKSTPQKKFIGMLILFVFIPLFVLGYGLYVTKWVPGLDTAIIAIAIALLGLYFYRRYKKQLSPSPVEETEPFEEAEPIGEETPEEEPGKTAEGNSKQ